LVLCTTAEVVLVGQAPADVLKSVLIRTSFGVENALATAQALTQLKVMLPGN
jgi:hypothetical protein